MLLSPRLHVTRRELEDTWTLAEVEEAHLALDLAEDAEILIDRALNPPGKPR